MIAEYMLNIREDGSVVTPSWIKSGGFFPNPDDKTLMGFCLPLSDRPYYIPDTVVFLSNTEAKDRAVAIHALYPMTQRDGTAMSDQDVRDMVQTIIDEEDV